MPNEPKPRPGRLRLIFRWTRIVCLFAVFLGVAAGAYLHLIGLPDFLKAELLDRLRERGFELQFVSARLGWGTEVLVDNASFHRTDRPLGPRLSAGRTQIRLNPARLLHGHVAVDSVSIAQGSLELPFSLATGDHLAVNNVFLDLDLLPNDTIRLNHGRADFHGIQFNLRGAVTNYLTARNLNLWPAGARTNEPAAARPSPRVEDESLRRLAATLDQIHFPTPPKIALNMTVDARDLDTTQAALDVDSSAAQTPWGGFDGLKLHAECLRPLHPGASPFVRLHASAAAVQTSAGKATNLILFADLLRTTDSNLQAALNFTAADFAARPPGGARNSITARQLHWDGNIKLQSAPLTLLGLSGELQAASLTTPWARVRSADVIVHGAVLPGLTAGGGWDFWNVPDRWTSDWQTDLAGVNTTDLQLEHFQCGGSWHAPEFVLTNVEAALYDGHLSGRARMDVASRELETSARIDVELHRLAPFLSASARVWLTNTTWTRPPQVAFGARATLPPWTNHPPDWAAALLPSLRLAGDFSIGAASSRGFSVNSFQTHFACTNQVWNLSGLRLRRPDGELSLDFAGGGAAPDYFLIVDSKMDPGAFRPLLPEEDRPFLDEASFAAGQPPQIHAEIHGRAGDTASVAIVATLRATNFMAHHERMEGLETAVAYSNSTLQLSQVHLWGNQGQLTADYIGADFPANRFTVSNALSTMDAGIVNRLMGRQTPPWLTVIGFDRPPTVHVEGSFNPDNDDFANLDFNVSGQSFRYHQLLADTLSGDVHWHGRHVALTNIQGALYRGTLAGSGVFDYKVGGQTSFRGHASVHEVELQSLVRSFSAERNPPEGILSMDATVSDGSSASRFSWRGSGHVSINHAQLWNIKLFGLFSPVLNAIIPGSGNSRAYQANADFVLTNAMLATDNLEIRSTDFRLLYRGSVDLDKKLDARVEAKILRDTPILGEVFSWAFSPLTKLFEYKISGTLDAPVSRPLYLPKMLTTLTEPFHKRKSGADTNSPPANNGSPEKSK